MEAITKRQTFYCHHDLPYVGGNWQALPGEKGRAAMTPCQGWAGIVGDEQGCARAIIEAAKEADPKEIAEELTERGLAV